MFHACRKYVAYALRQPWLQSNYLPCVFTFLWQTEKKPVFLAMQTRSL